MRIQGLGRLTAAAVGLAFSAAGVGCSGTSGYSLDMRNNTGEVVKVELMSSAKGEEPKMVATSRVSPGANTTMFTKAPAGANVMMQARIDGDTVSDPALKRVTLGLTQLTINTAPTRADQPPKAPKLVIVERHE
jgi:hypothetical protein